MDDAQNQQKSLTDELICPITLELPWQPVTAEDGQVYEKCAIEKHIENNKDQELRSPITNEPMGYRLFSAPKTKNLIEILIKSKMIVGVLADSWEEKVEENQLQALIKKAEAGNTVPLYNRAVNYKQGLSGFKQDKQLAYRCFRKAHELGDNEATASLGELLADLPYGLPENREAGIMYLGIAAAKGSPFAAAVLGLALARGWYGLSVNKMQASYWLDQVTALGDLLDDDLRISVQYTLRSLKRDDLFAA